MNLVISLTFTYLGELSGFMQKSQVFFVEFRKHWVEVRNNGCFRGLRFGLVAFLLFLFTYLGELSVFMQNSQVFFDNVLQTLTGLTDSAKETGFFTELRCGTKYFLKKPGFWATMRQR